jgi:hypothetical protein
MKKSHIMALCAAMSLSAIAHGALIDNLSISTTNTPVVSTLKNGTLAFTNRGHIYTNVPASILNAEVVAFLMEERTNPSFTASFTLTEEADVYLFIDKRITVSTSMPWVDAQGFVLQDFELQLDENADGTTENPFAVYKKRFSAVQVNLEEQNTGGVNMYGVAAHNPLPLLFTSSNPTDGASGVVTNPVVSCTIEDGTQTLVDSSVEMTFDGSTVTPTITKLDGVSTLSYQASGLEPLSNYTAQVVFSGASAGPYTNSWSFTTMDRLLTGATVPANGTPGVDTDTIISAQIIDGTDELLESTVVMTLNGNIVPHTLSKLGTTSTVSYAATGLETSSNYTAQVVYASALSSLYTNTWSFLTMDPSPPLAYEAFYYLQPNGTSINGLNGGIGWKEAYPNPSGPHTLTNGLTFAGAVTAGGAVVRTAGATLSGNGRNWSYNVPLDSTIWYSFMLKAVNTSGGTFGILQNNGSNQDGFGIVIRSTGDHGFPAGTLAIQAAAGSAPGAWINLGSVPETFEKTYLIVGRLLLNSTGDSSNQIWVYESLPTEAEQAGLGTSSAAGPLGTKIPAMYGRAWSNSGPTIFDEVRVGTSFEQVVGTLFYPYDLWANAVGLPAGSRGKTDDADNDGASNYAEYALNGNPLDSSDTGKFDLVVDGTTVHVIYSQLKEDNTVSYSLVNKDNLVVGTETTNAYISQVAGPSDSQLYNSVTNVYNVGDKDFFKVVIGTSE